jgi:hypothetical protein
MAELDVNQTCFFVVAACFLDRIDFESTENVVDIRRETFRFVQIFACGGLGDGGCEWKLIRSFCRGIGSLAQSDHAPQCLPG